jgi:predicted dehydrogenase
MTKDERTIRVGLVGYGFAGKTFHAPLIRSVPGLDLTAVSTSRTAEAAADLPGIRILEAKNLVTDADLDLIVIASPNESHFPLAAAALRAGKDVVVDKPFTVTLAEARSLAEIAQESGRLLSVFHNRRWESEVKAAKAVLDSGALGEVRHFECHMDRFRPNVRHRWREDPGPGAGLFFDLGPHLIDLALYFFGLPESISASLAVMRDGGQTDDWAHVQLNYQRLKVILHTSLLVAPGAPRTVVHGTKGSWFKFGADVQEPQLMKGMLPSDPGFGIDPDPGVLVDGATGQRTLIAAPAGNQQMYYAGILEAILGGQPPAIPARDAIAVMAVLETCFASSDSGKVLPLPLTPEERAAWS